MKFGGGAIGIDSGIDIGNRISSGRSGIHSHDDFVMSGFRA